MVEASACTSVFFVVFGVMLVLLRAQATRKPSSATSLNMPKLDAFAAEPSKGLRCPGHALDNNQYRRDSVTDQDSARGKPTPKPRGPEYP